MPHKDERNVRAVTSHLSRGQILHATDRCLHDFGYDATTIRRIASCLGCAVGSIYRYFPDKRDLLFAVTQQILQPVAEQAERGAAVDQCERLYRECVDASPQAYRLMFWLSCVTGASTTGNANRLPDVVERIIDGWDRSLGDREQAKARWAALHAAVILGNHQEPVQEKPPTLTDQNDHRAKLLAALPPLPVPSTADSASRTNEFDPEQSPAVAVGGTAAIERESVEEDVCLL